MHDRLFAADLRWVAERATTILKASDRTQRRKAHRDALRELAKLNRSAESAESGIARQNLLEAVLADPRLLSQIAHDAVMIEALPRVKPGEHGSVPPDPMALARVHLANGGVVDVLPLQEAIDE